MSRLRIIIAFCSGLALGWLYLMVIHPLLGGMKGGGFLLERGYAIEIIFWGMPTILILVIITTALTFPTSANETFKLSSATALACLYPIPIFEYFSKVSAVYRRPVFSLFILGDAAISIVCIAFAVFMIAGISTLVLSLWINPLLGKIVGRFRS